MPWTVLFHAEFRPEFKAMPEDAREKMLATVRLLRDDGPQLGRPFADTLKGSAYGNMKELRWHTGDGEWRAAFAFDKKQQAIVLVAGDKKGADQVKFYKRLIKVADERYAAHVAQIKADDERKKAEAKKSKK